MKLTYLGLIFVALMSVSCAGLLPTREPSLPGARTQPANPSEATPQGTPTAVPPLVGTATPAGVITLRLWVPPIFDPSAETEAAKVFRNRLQEFERRQPGVRLEVRLKAIDGRGGIYDSLVSANAAAPLALPDLVALPHDLLQAAALKGLLRLLDPLQTVLEEPDWYEVARQIARVQGSAYGIPFAIDAQALVYRTKTIQNPPADWQGVLQSGRLFIFPASDPKALFTLTLYQSKGGAIQDKDGRPFLNAETLAEVLSFYLEAEKSGVMPYWLTQYATEEQIWAAFQEKPADMVVTWTSRYMNASLADIALAPLPAAEGKPYTLARGWVWALATPYIERQELSVRLAEFLSEANYLAEWNRAMGLLPPRPSSLNIIPDPVTRSLLDQIAQSAHVYPSADVLTELGAALQEATVSILKQQSDPLSAAQAAVKRLSAQP